LWVAKEAVAKALGEGLSDCLSNFEVFLNEPSGACVRAVDPALDGLTLRELNLPGAAAAVAVRGPVQEVRLRRFVPNA
jgi:phosphopantetheinyl transferase